MLTWHAPFHKNLLTLFFQKPREGFLGNRLSYRGVGQKRSQVMVQDFFYYVPLVEQLKVLLLNPKYRHEVFKEKIQPQNGILNDIDDGTIVHTHPLLSLQGNSLKIVLYFDDVELCNPIGTRRLIHKVGLFYYSVMNLEPKFRSRLESINLYAAALSTHIKEHGIDAVLRPFKQDLEQLSVGIHLSDGVLVTGALLAFVADTPASHLAGGFKEGVGFAFQKCRHCNADQISMQENFTADAFTLRSRTAHNAQCTRIETTPNDELRSHYSAVFGINRRSILCDFPFFDVTQNLPQDVMHVLLEGVLPLELKAFIQYCIQENLITIEVLNSRIKSFPYGYYQSKDIPKPVNANIFNDQSAYLLDDAIKMWTLCRILPFLVKDIVDEQNEHWQNMKQVLQITNICMSQFISLESVSILPALISEHLSQFKELYNRPITPKQHYLVHIPMLIVMYGPPIRLWCTRYEAKHRFFKKIARLGNFKNIAKSLCERHQCLHATIFFPGHLHGSSNPLFKKLEIGKSTQLMDNEFLLAANTVYTKGFMNRNDKPVHTIFDAKWVVQFGIKYKLNESVVFLSFNKERELPMFGKVEKIWVLNFEKVILFCSLVESIAYCETLFSYEVLPPATVDEEELQVIDLDCVDVHEVSHVIKYGAKMYLNFRNNLSELFNHM